MKLLEMNGTEFSERFVDTLQIEIESIPHNYLGTVNWMYKAHDNTMGLLLWEEDSTFGTHTVVYVTANPDKPGTFTVWMSLPGDCSHEQDESMNNQFVFVEGTKIFDYHVIEVRQAIEDIRIFFKTEGPPINREFTRVTKEEQYYTV